MAVNSFNPRLFSSSSENDVEEGFRHKGASVAPLGGNLTKSRCFSEPSALQNGKGGKKEDTLKMSSAALSDSSNKLQRSRGRPARSFEVLEKKEQCMPIYEESSVLSSDEHDNSGELPEPENNREAAKTSNCFGYDHDPEFSMMPQIGRMTPVDLMELNTDLEENDDVFYADHLNQPEGDDEDDMNYPEKESFPAGYRGFPCDDGSYNPISPWDLPKCIRKSYDDLGSPVLPDADQLFGDVPMYPSSMMDFADIPPPTPLPMSFSVSEDSGFDD